MYFYTYYSKVPWRQHYEPYTHLKIGWLQIRLWQQPDPKFYRLGRYIVAEVKPIDKRWPTCIHKIRADWLSWHVARDLYLKQLKRKTK